MADPTTYFKIDRAIFDNPLWNELPYDRAHAWIWIIGNANFAETKSIYRGQAQVTKRGQLRTSDAALAEKFGWSRGKVRRFIEYLVNEKMCTVERTPNGTTLTIENYSKFQDARTTNGTTDSTTHGTTDGTHNKNVKKDIKGEEYARTRATPDASRSLEEIAAENEKRRVETMTRMAERFPSKRKGGNK